MTYRIILSQPNSTSSLGESYFTSLAKCHRFLDEFCQNYDIQLQVDNKLSYQYEDFNYSGIQMGDLVDIDGMIFFNYTIWKVKIK